MQQARLVKTTNHLVREFRSDGLPVFWVRQESAPDLHDAFPEVREKEASCVRMTAIDDYQRDHVVIIASDCVASYDPEHHDVTMMSRVGTWTGRSPGY